MWYNLALARTEIGGREGTIQAWIAYLKCQPDAAERAAIEATIQHLARA